MSDPHLPMDTPVLHEQKQSDYCLDMCIERGPHISVRLTKLAARAAFAQIRKAMEGNAESAVVHVEHDGSETIVNVDAVLVASIRPWIDPQQAYAEENLQQGAQLIGRIGPRGGGRIN